MSTPRTPEQAALSDNRIQGALSLDYYHEGDWVVVSSRGKVGYVETPHRICSIHPEEGVVVVAYFLGLRATLFWYEIELDPLTALARCLDE